MNFRLQGVIVPLVTPFAAHGRLDLAAIPRLVNHLIACGVAGLFPGGTTGEGFLLSLEERRQLAASVGYRLQHHIFPLSFDQDLSSRKAKSPGQPHCLASAMLEDFCRHNSYIVYLHCHFVKCTAVGVH